MKKLLYFLFLIILVSIPVYIKYSQVIGFSFSEKKIIEVQDGETFYSLGKKFGLNETFYKLFLKLNPPNFTLQKGKYEIEAKKTLKDILDSMKKPLSEDESITLLEGWNIYDIDAELTKKGLITAGSFSQLTSTQATTFRGDFAFLSSAQSLEGYLYPDTYNINPNTFSQESFVRQMLTNFYEKVVKNIPQTSPDELYKIVNIASILEKEEKSESGRPTVAGILKKRIAEGWMLGADATVCYPYKLTFVECTPSFIGNHIEDKNDYNTRTKLGLPTTPISNPSFSSIKAVIFPVESEYYYYLHDSSGNIHYARTNEEHIANKTLYIR